MVSFYEGASIPWRESVPAPQYPTLNPNVLGNALSNLVGNFQKAEQGAQGTQLNDLALQQQKMRLDQSRAFAGGVPKNADGSLNWSKIAEMQAQAGNPNALGALAGIIQHDQDLKGAFGPDPFLGGGGVTGSPGASGGFMGALHQAESGDRNIFSAVDPDPSGPGTRSQGYDQINVPTWLEFAPRAGVDVNRYPTPMSAPEDVQDRVAKTIPLGRFGPRTRKLLESQYGFGDDAKNLTVGELASRFGDGGGGVQVASLDPAAYATPETPAAPPVSAAAGSTIPRASAPTAVQAVGGSVASIVAGAVPDQQRAALVARNIGQLMGVDPAAPLTPAQAQRVKGGVQAYIARTGQVPQSPRTAQVPSSQGGPILPQFPLPKGYTDPQQAILAIDQDIARLSRFGPAANGPIRALEDIRSRIAASSAPMDVRPGQTIIDPRTGRTLFQSPVMSGRYGVTQDKADDIAQAIESGDQPPVLTGLYGASSLVRSSLAKNGFDLSKAQLQWDAAKKQITSLNGPQQVRFVGLANSVVNTIDEVKDLSQQMQLAGVPLLNKAKLLSYIQLQGNSEKGQLATRYINAVNTAKEEFANLANGNYAPTDAAWKLANDQINGNYGVKQLDAALSESQRLIKYRLAAMPGMSTAGPGAANRYFPGNEQAPPPPAARSGVAPRKITTKSDYDALKSGDQYEAPDGSIRTKQ